MYVKYGHKYGHNRKFLTIDEPLPYMNHVDYSFESCISNA